MDDFRTQKTAGDLEWSLLCDRLASLATGASAGERLRALMPAPAIAEAQARVTRVTDVLAVRARDAALPVRAVIDPGELLGRVRRGTPANGRELRDLAVMLALAAELRRFGKGASARHPALASAIDSPPSIDPLREQLDEAIEADGRVADRASRTLADARRRVAESRRELVSRLNHLIGRYAEVLRDSYYAERDGRYVLPVRSDAQFRVPGIVLGSSASGGTLYVEPEEITALGNRLSVAEAEVEREEARVLADLSDAVRAHADAVAIAGEACVTADMLTAIARWAEAAAAIPLAPNADPRVALRGMRHPLLVGTGIEVVANDLALEGGQALVISGPNAGGKTVALKCLGLCAWMARAGLPIPAEPGSAIGWFDPVLTDVGDDQSLAKSLSTFSAHVANLAAIIGEAGDHALALLDEVAAGTDPAEGCALATAVLEALIARGAAIAVTTHYERLKELAVSDPRFVNASVGFDVQAMLPTFRLALGVPGASSALSVAGRFGIPPAIVERARELLPLQAREREGLLARIEEERRALEEARRDAQETTERQRELTSDLEEQIRRARAEERARLQREAAALTADVLQARAALREATQRLRRGADAGKSPKGGGAAGELKQIEREIDAASRHIAALSQGDSAPDRQQLVESDLAIGTRVTVARLGATAEVIDAPVRGQVRVQVGAMRMLVALDELSRAPAKSKGEPRRPRQEEKRAIAMVGRHVPVRTSGTTLDLRGQRVDEALDQVDAFVDRMLREGEPAAFVLHGHGTGALKIAVREHLGASTLVEHSEPAGADDGGDAFTVLWLA